MAKTAMTYNGEGRVGAQRFDNCVVETGSLQYARFDGGYFDGDGMAHYLVPDFQGNTAMDIDELCNVVQETHYYPYGEPWSQPQGQPWLFGGKERERRHHLGDSDFGARTYNAARATFARPDPLAEKYYPITPYAYCAADPVNHIDPSGKDIYKVNPDGSFSFLQTNMNLYHIIIGLMTDSYIYVPLDFFTALKETEGRDENDYSVTFTVSYYHLETDGTSEFEFIASNSDVEWSHMEMNDGTSIISTSNMYGADGSIGGILTTNSELFFSISNITHSHTNDDTTASPKDIEIAERIEAINPTISFQVFNTKHKSHTTYNGASSTIQILNEVTVRPKENSKSINNVLKNVLNYISHEHFNN